MTIIVVIACHFKSKTELCDTTIARLEKALNLLYERDTWFVVGGNVPYERGGKTLQELMLQWFISRRVPADRVLFNKGTGTFSEARETLKQIQWFCEHRRCPRGYKIYVVSSSWWLWSGQLIWKKFALAYPFTIKFFEARHTAGWRTRFTYAVFSVIVRASFIFGFSSFVESKLTAMQAKRLEGFTWNGCA